MTLRSADERFARFELIDWWDQARLRDAKLAVVGIGALGNEIVKNCALLGVGHLAVIDADRVETSNLSRSVLFRSADAGRPKVEAAARAAREIYPKIEVAAIAGDVVHDVGLGLFRWADLVLGALDNREARLAVNRHCYRVGTAWIDGATESLSGVARVFCPPDGACYECTLSEVDWELLEQRHSCTLLNRELLQFDRVPTTPTTASVIAGIQCQEGLKLLHDRPALSGSGFVFDGVGHSSYLVSYTRNPDCLSHEPLERVREVDRRADDVSVGEALAWAQKDLGPAASLEFVRELLLSLDCPSCGRSERVFRPLSAVSEREGECPSCGARRIPKLFHRVDGREDFLDQTLTEIGLPPWDVVVGLAGHERQGYELAGDRVSVLGPIAGEAGTSLDTQGG
jgi:molybdopterin/thiamine biosynthesis adenylyltransferase